MQDIPRRMLAVFLSFQLSFLGIVLQGCGARQTPQTSAPAPVSPGLQPKDATQLRSLLQKSYAELFDLAPTLELGTTEIAAQRTALGKGKDFCVARFKDHAKQYGKQVDTAQKDLKKKTAGLTEDQRSQLHCKIQNLELLRSEAQALSGHAIPTAYDNLNAKLDVIEKWPALHKQTQQEMASGTHLSRRWGDVRDIGFREIAANQQDDIKKGQQAIEEC